MDRLLESLRKVSTLVGEERPGRCGSVAVSAPKRKGKGKPTESPAPARVMTVQDGSHVSLEDTELEEGSGVYKTCKYCSERATKGYIWADGRAIIPVCEAHGSRAKRRIEGKNDDEVAKIVDLDSDGKIVKEARKRRIGDLQRAASNVAALKAKLANLQAKTGVGSVTGKKFKAGAATAKADMKRHGVEYASRVPGKKDHPDWVEGYLSALPFEVATQARRRLAEAELEEEAKPKGGDFGEMIREKLQGLGTWKYQDHAGPMSYGLKCDDVGKHNEEVRRKLKRFLLGQGFKLAKTVGKPDDFEWGAPYRQTYKRGQDTVSIESSSPFKGMRITYSKGIKVRGPEGPGAPKPARRDFTGQGSLFGESAGRLGELLEALKLRLPSGAAQQIKADPLGYIARAAMDAQVDLRGADSMADLIARTDPPPPRAAMVDARDAAELVGKARAGAWRAKGLLKDLVRHLHGRPSVASMALEDTEEVE